MLKYIKTAIPVILLVLVGACKNPTEDIKLVVDTNIIKYSALLHISDAANPGVIPANLAISVNGSVAENVYEISGKKQLVVKDGIISLGLHPSVAPTAGSTVKFNVVISAPGYQTLTREIQMTEGQFQQVINIGITKTAPTPPPANPPIVVPPAPTSTKVVLDFRGYCPNKSNLEIRPSIYVFFKESNTNTAYQYLGYMDKGHIETNFLTMGKTYDFKITFAGENYTVTRKIEQTSYTETITMGSSACSTF